MKKWVFYFLVLTLISIAAHPADTFYRVHLIGCTLLGIIGMYGIPLYQAYKDKNSNNGKQRTV